MLSIRSVPPRLLRSFRLKSRLLVTHSRRHSRSLFCRLACLVRLRPLRFQARHLCLPFQLGLVLLFLPSLLRLQPGVLQPGHLRTPCLLLALLLGQSSLCRLLDPIVPTRHTGHTTPMPPRPSCRISVYRMKTC